MNNSTVLAMNQPSVLATHRVVCRRNEHIKLTNIARHSEQTWRERWTLCTVCGGGASIEPLEAPQQATLRELYSARLGLEPNPADVA